MHSVYNITGKKANDKYITYRKKFAFFCYILYNTLQIEFYLSY